MKNTKKLLALVLALMLVLTAFAGCNSGSETSSSPEESSATNEESTSGEESTEEESTLPALDTSEEVELVMYFISDRPGGYDDIEANWNELFKEKFNCTLKTEWLAWSDYSNKYPLLFSSGEKFDMAYTATWLNFYSYASKGAFMALDELWPTYAPNIWEKTSAAAKTQATVNGELVCIPTLLATYYGFGPYYRTDCLEGTDWDGKMENFEDYEVYLDYIKANTDLQPYSVGSAGSELDDVWLLNHGKYAIRGTSWLHVDLSEDKYTLRPWYQADDVMTFLETMKRWSDKGFWSPSALSDTEAAKPKNGIAASACHNIDTYTSLVIDAQQQGNGFVWEYANFNVEGISNLPFTQDAAVIPVTAENPERMLAVYDYIVTDREAYDAFQYGIEGTSYELINEQVNMINTDKYAGTGMWAARNSELNRDSVGYPQSAVDMKAEWDEMIAAKGNTGAQYLSGWTPDTSVVETEYAACSNVIQQYWWPLELGFTTDIEASLAEFQQQMEAAGVDKVLEAFQAQLDEYCATYPEG